MCEAMDEACCVVLSVTEAVHGVAASAAAVLSYTVLPQKKGQTTGRSPPRGAACRS